MAPKPVLLQVRRVGLDTLSMSISVHVFLSLNLSVNFQSLSLSISLLSSTYVLHLITGDDKMSSWLVSKKELHTSLSHTQHIHILCLFGTLLKPFLLKRFISLDKVFSC